MELNQKLVNYELIIMIKYNVKFNLNKSKIVPLINKKS